MSLYRSTFTRGPRRVRVCSSLNTVDFTTLRASHQLALRPFLLRSPCTRMRSVRTGHRSPRAATLSSSPMARARRLALRTEPAAEAAGAYPVTPLELLFDLVFVFAFTQVTAVLSDDPTWSGLAHGLLILTALWWAWASYAWLDEHGRSRGRRRVGRDAGGDGGDVHRGARRPGRLRQSRGPVRRRIPDREPHVPDADDARGAWRFRTAGGDPRIAPAALVGSALIVAAGFADGRLRSLLWLAAVVIGLVTPLFTGLRGWNVQPAHFVERHGLIVIIAIGESMFAMGIGARGTSLDAGVIAAAVLGLAVATSFWLAYFDFFQLRAEQLLRERSGLERVALARDIFTYLHLPMVAGIVLFAFGVEATLAHVGDELGTIPALGLCGGPSLYLFSFVALRWRVSRSFGHGRLVACRRRSRCYGRSPSPCRRSSLLRSSPPSGSHCTPTSWSGGAMPAPRRARSGSRSSRERGGGHILDVGRELAICDLAGDPRRHLSGGDAELRREQPAGGARALWRPCRARSCGGRARSPGAALVRRQRRLRRLGRPLRAATSGRAPSASRDRCGRAAFGLDPGRSPLPHPRRADGSLLRARHDDRLEARRRPLDGG